MLVSRLSLPGRTLLIAVLGAALACSRGSQGAPQGAPAAESTFARAEGVRVVVAADGFTQPVFLTQAPGDPRLFVVEQPGRVRWIENGRASSGVFLDLRDRVSSGGERGLLGLAFHPDYAANGWFYANYTDRDGDTQVVRFTASGSPRTVSPASAHRILTVDQPYANHNGGMIAFGPDRMLWIGMGDGGAGGDPHGHGQNPRTLLAKMLRLDVDHGDPYAIPDGNPYKHRRDQGAPELWALGLRNPWRFSFDRATGNLIIGDVGQNQWEEIDVADSGRPGLNYGWNLREGSHRYGRPRPSPPALVAPAVEYDHEEGCSVTGGYAYRGTAIPALAGTIFFSDYCRGWLRSFRWDGVRARELREWSVGSLGSVTSFGEDQAGELYVLTHEGRIWKLAAR